MEKPVWIKEKTYADDFEIIVGSFNPYADFNLDPKGYFLIRLNKEEDYIELAHCRNDHTITKVVKGKKAQEVYITVCKLKLVSLLEHAAYLGKELKKAELALEKGLNYEQE